MISSRSEFIHVRGLRYHVRRWGDAARPRIFLGHGWLDTSATFAPLVAPLLDRWQVLAPDWRGFGYSQWPDDGYWFPDYVGDLEAIVDHYSPDEPLRLVGHSMGAQILSLYAGLRPARVRALVCLDGLFLPDMPAELAPKRFRAWLDELKDLPQQKYYPSFEVLAERVRKQHPQLSAEQTLFIARCWGHEDARGKIGLLADPKHRMNGPGLYKAAESLAIWRCVTVPTLFIDAGKSAFSRVIPPEEVARRRACFANRREAVIAEGGHMLHFDAPVPTAQRIAEFLSSLE